MAGTRSLRSARGLSLALAAALGVLAGSGGTALASSRPSFRPPPATGPIFVEPLSPTSVLLQAPLDPNGSETTYAFYYGRTARYGSSTARRDAGSGNTMVKVSALLSGLSPGATYHVRLVATNSGGSVSSGDQTFVTEPAGATRGTTINPPTGQPGPVGAGNPPGPAAAEGLVKVPVANAAGYFDGLSGVSCASGFCLGVGFQGRAGALVRPLAERFTGSSFAAIPAPATPGASLYGVACVTSADCMAVGRDGRNTYSARWSGHVWVVEPTVSPAGGDGDILRSVSCVSATDCWASGYSAAETRAMTLLIEHWNGRNWSLSAAPRPPGSLLNAISCASAGNCWAVGALDAYPGVGSLLAEHWNGTTWSVFRGSGPSRSAGEYDAVFCPGASECWASGSGTSASFVIRLLGGGWHLVADQSIAAFGAAAVACGAPQSCLAVGLGLSAEEWNGRTWAVALGPSHVGGGFTDDACPTRSECVAVGIVENPTTNSNSSQRAVAYVTRPG